MTKQEKRERMEAVVAALKEIYPQPTCALEYEGDPWKLLVMGRLSAQCTDARVNIVCKELFAKYPSAVDMAQADIADLEQIVRPCGFFRMKADNLREASRRLVDVYGGELPDTMEELLTFPGVGRKIANLLLGDVFGKEAIVCDTHCMRICGRLGFYREGWKDPTHIEMQLREIMPAGEGSDFCHRIVLFGRDVCTARSAHCEGCPLFDLCEHKRREEGKVKTDA